MPGFNEEQMKELKALMAEFVAMSASNEVPVEKDSVFISLNEQFKMLREEMGGHIALHNAIVFRYRMALTSQDDTYNRSYYKPIRGYYNKCRGKRHDVLPQRQWEARLDEMVDFIAEHNGRVTAKGVFFPDEQQKE